MDRILAGFIPDKLAEEIEAASELEDVLSASVDEEENDDGTLIEIGALNAVIGGAATIDVTNFAGLACAITGSRGTASDSRNTTNRNCNWMPDDRTNGTASNPVVIRIIGNDNDNILIASDATNAELTIPAGRHVRIIRHPSNASVTSSIWQNNVGQRHFTVNGSLQLGSTANNTNVSLSRNAGTMGYGGGVQVNTSGTLTLNAGSSIQNNQFDGNGGAVRVIDGTFNMNGGTIQNNTASQGGGVNVSGPSANFTMSGGVIQNNYAANVVPGSGAGINTQGGGGVLVQNGALFTMNGPSTGTSATRISGNNAYNGGGGVLVRNPGSRFEMNGGTIRDNNPRLAPLIAANRPALPPAWIAPTEANGTNGGLLTRGGGVSVTQEASMTMNTSGSNIPRVEGNIADQGAGIRVSFNAELTINSGQVLNNTAGANGGGIHTSDGTVTLETGTLISGNRTLGEAVPGAGGVGAGIRIADGSTVTMSGGTIENNHALRGAGVDMSNINSTFTMSGGAIRNNQAQPNPRAGSNNTNNNRNAGGGLHMDLASRAYLSNSATITGNSAANGGGVYVRASANLIMDSGEIRGNHAEENGGGIYTDLSDYADPLTDPTAYTNLILSEDVIFEDNTAGNGAFTPPSNAETFVGAAGIETRHTSRYHHPLNNYDINYEGSNTTPTEPETTVPPTEATVPVTEPTEPETTVPPTTDPVETTTPETTVPATTDSTDPTGTAATTDPNEPTGTTAPGTDPSEPTTALPTDPGPLEDPELMKEVCALVPAENLVATIRQLIDCGFGDVAEAEVGQSVRYRLTISNPNDVALEDILVVDTLDLNLVEFVGNVMINGIVAVSPEDYTFNVTTGELRIYLSELPIDGAVITFDVIVLAGNENDEIPNVAYLFGPEDTNGDREPINEDDALIIVDEEEPQPTTIPEETTVPTEPATTVPVTEPTTTDPTQPSETTVPATTDPSQPMETDPEPTTVPATTNPTEPTGTTAPVTEPTTEPELTTLPGAMLPPAEPVGSEPTIPRSGSTRSGGTGFRTRALSTEPTEPTEPFVCIDGQTIVVLPMEVVPSDLLDITASPGWSYEFVQTNGGRYIIVITPPTAGRESGGEVVITFPDRIQPEEIEVCLADDLIYEVDPETGRMIIVGRRREEETNDNEDDEETSSGGRNSDFLLPEMGIRAHLAFIGFSLTGFGISIMALKRRRQ